MAKQSALWATLLTQLFQSPAFLRERSEASMPPPPDGATASSTRLKHSIACIISHHTSQQRTAYLCELISLHSFYQLRLGFFCIPL